MTPAEGIDESAGPNEELRGRATDSSAVIAAIRDVRDRLGTVVRTSFLYRWLTNEPDPEVIVIDLRETYTVGPVIALLDRVVEWAGPYWQESTPKAAVDALYSVGRRAADTRAGRLLTAVLAPPEPSDSDSTQESSDDPADR